MMEMGRILKIVSTIFFVVACGKSFSQPAYVEKENNSHLIIQEKWTDGKVVLTDNSSYEGKVSFQENFDLIKVKSGAVIKTFTPKQVRYFTCFDEEENYERYYISIPVDRNNNKTTSLVFFEVIKETKDLALLSRKFNINTASTKGLYDNMGSMTILTPYGPYTIPGAFGPIISLNNKSVTLKETLYLANDEGSIEPFSVILYKDVAPDKCKLLDKSLIRAFFGDRYKDCKKFVDQYDLDLKEKDDLISLLEYYERID